MWYITMRRRDTEQIVRTASINSNEVITDPFKGHIDCIAHQ